MWPATARARARHLTFTTIGPPTVESVVPAANASAVPVRHGDPDHVRSITWTPRHVLDGLTIVPDAPFTATWNGQTLSIVPNNPLSFSTTYTIKLGDSFVDTDGTPLSPYVTTFTTIGWV